MSYEYVIGNPSGSEAAIVTADVVPSAFKSSVDAGVVVNVGISSPPEGILSHSDPS